MGLVFGCDLPFVIDKLSESKSGPKLKFIKGFAAEGVGPGAAGDSSAACGETDNGVVILGLIVKSLTGAAGGSDHLLCHFTFGIVIIPKGADKGPCGYGFAGKGDIRLGGADDFIILIFISILFFTDFVK